MANNTASLRSASIPYLLKMIKENIPFVLPTGENCELTLTELNHKVVAIQPLITLNNPTIPHTCFQDIINFILSSNKSYINKVYFESLKFKYRFISFNLFGHVRAAFKKELKRHVLISDLISGKETYDWIEPGFLPKFPDDIDHILDLAEKHPNCLVLASKKGVIQEWNYEMTNIKIDYNYVYDLHPTDLIPLFDTYISATLNVLPPPFTDPDTIPHMKSIIAKIITEKYNKLGANLKLL